jgi:uncharacterized protein YaaR (DUF327 family)
VRAAEIFLEELEQEQENRAKSAEKIDVRGEVIKRFIKKVLKNILETEKSKKITILQAHPLHHLLKSET